jgi:serine protease Do
VVRPDDAELQALLARFVRVKRTSMHDVDLTVFDFDYDLTWWAMVVDAHQRVYTRLGGSDNVDPASRLSSAAMKHTLRLVLDEHARRSGEPPPPPAPTVRPVDLFGIKGKCMHCHQVNENFYKRDKLRAHDLDKLRFLPAPENVGLSLVVDQGNRIHSVHPDSAAARAGLQPGDELYRLGTTRTLSQGDVMWALSRAAPEGTVPVVYVRGGELHETMLPLAAGWKQMDLSWRRSVRKLKP